MTIALVVKRRDDIEAAVARAKRLPVWDGEHEVSVRHRAGYVSAKMRDGRGWRVEWEADA